MRRRQLKKNEIVRKVQDKIFQILVNVQYLYIRCKMKPIEINLILLKFLILLHSLQEIQLISQNLANEEQRSQNLLKLMEKHSLNLINYNKNLGVLIILSFIQISFTILRILVYFQSEFKTAEAIFQYFIVLHHNIILLPIINLSIEFLSSGNYIIIVLIILSLAILSDLEFCLFNIQNSIIEIEMCYSTRLKNVIYLICSILICFFNTNFSIYYIGQGILLFSKCIEILDIIHNYHFNSDFYQEIILFVISYAITLLLMQNWIFTLLAFILLYQLRQQIRLRKIQIELIDKNEDQNFFKYNLVDNAEFLRCFESLFYIFKQTQSEKMRMYQMDNIKHGLLPEKLLIILSVFRHKKIQLYLNMINIQKDHQTFLERVRLEANLINVISQCQKLISAPLNIEMFIKSLEVEQRNFDLLIELIDQKVQFYNFLIKEVPINQYLVNFKIETDKIIQRLAKIKSNFEKQYNFKGVRLQEFSKSDQVSINIIKSFFSVFYNNNFRVQEFEKQQNDLLIYDKIMNQKIMKNEVMLISISYIKNQYSITNKGNKRLLQIIGDRLEPQKIIELLPTFQSNFYGDLLSQYIYQGFEIQQPTRLYFEINSFLVEYDLYLYSTISNDDIILHNYLVEKSQPNHFTLFDKEGRICGISREIYQYFTSKSENQYTKTLPVNEFITAGMIQYYVPDIYTHLLELIKIVSLEKEFQNSIIITSRWQFPINHKKCLESTSQLGLVNDDATTPSQFKKIFYSSSTKRMLQMKKSVKNDQIPTIKNIKLKMLQQSFMSQIQQLVVPASRLKSLEYQGSLEFSLFRFIESEFHYFILRFHEIEEFKQIGQNEIVANQSLIKNEAKYDGLLLDYAFLENSINSTELFILLRYDIAIVTLMILVSVLALMLVYNNNYQATIYYQQSVNFLQAPQAMTFCYAEPFLLNWNKYCADNKLYELSPYIEFQRVNMLEYVFSYCDSVSLMYTLNMNDKSYLLQDQSFNMISYLDNKKYTQAIDIFEFYTITYELFSRQYKDFVSSNNTPDYSIFRTNGTIRQNVLPIFQFHNIVLDGIIEDTNQSFVSLSNKNYMILLYSTISVTFLLIVFTCINYKLLRCQEKIIKLIRFLNYQLILDHIDQLNQQKEILQRLFLNNYDKFDATPTQKNSEQVLQFQSKVSTLRKIESFREKQIVYLILSLAIGIQLIAFIFGSQLIAVLYSSPYQSSLILTMQYLKLKNHLDQSILLGELIKTEQYIPSNDINLINQSETIQFFTQSLGDLQILSNNINNELVSTHSFNTTFKKKLIDVFNNNLCKQYPSVLIFCNTSNIPLEHYPNDDYSTFVENGIYGIVQEINKLSNQEYSYETTNNRYENDLVHSFNFLHLQVHSNLFVSFYMDIQKCLYYNFVDLYTETQNLSDKLLEQILIYLVASSIIFFSATTIVSWFWIKQQLIKLNQVKLIATLFPPELLQQKGFKNLLYSQLIKIK